jgi:hypothetical protein
MDDYGNTESGIQNDGRGTMVAGGESDTADMAVQTNLHSTSHGDRAMTWARHFPDGRKSNRPIGPRTLHE